jgi:hypothetical protein
MKNIIVLTSLCAVLYGCLYTVPVTISPAANTAANIYSSYKDKIQGSVVLVIDENLRNIDRKVKPLSSACSGHKYPLKIESWFADSIKEITEVIFNRVIEQNTLPTKEQLEQMNCQGSIYVKLYVLYPTLRVCDGTALATCELVLDVMIKDSKDNNLLVTTVRGARFAEGGPGGYCGGGAKVLSDAISLSLREAMQWYAERISNSEKIRKAFVPKGN